MMFSAFLVAQMKAVSRNEMMVLMVFILASLKKNSYTYQAVAAALQAAGKSELVITGFLKGEVSS